MRYHRIKQFDTEIALFCKSLSHLCIDSLEMTEPHYISNKTSQHALLSHSDYTWEYEYYEYGPVSFKDLKAHKCKSQLDVFYVQILFCPFSIIVFKMHILKSGFFPLSITDSIVIGFWVGLAVFVIFMFFVLTLLTKTGVPHQE